MCTTMNLFLTDLRKLQSPQDRTLTSSLSAEFQRQHTCYSEHIQHYRKIIDQIDRSLVYPEGLSPLSQTDFAGLSAIYHTASRQLMIEKAPMMLITEEVSAYPLQLVCLLPKTNQLLFLIKQEFINDLSETQQLFCLSHEMSHYIFKHLPLLTVLRTRKGPESSFLVEWNLQQWKLYSNISADRVGLQVCRDHQAAVTATLYACDMPLPNASRLDAASFPDYAQQIIKQKETFSPDDHDLLQRIAVLSYQEYARDEQEISDILARVSRGPEEGSEEFTEMSIITLGTYAILKSFSTIPDTAFSELLLHVFTEYTEDPILTVKDIIESHSTKSFLSAFCEYESSCSLADRRRSFSRILELILTEEAFGPVQSRIASFIGGLLGLSDHEADTTIAEIQETVLPMELSDAYLFELHDIYHAIEGNWIKELIEQHSL